MGAIADGIVAYAKPLLEQTDGSVEQMNKAFSIATLCFNLALMPEDSRDEAIKDIQSSLAMEDEELDVFRNSIIVPMLRRHEEMFPLMHGRDSVGPSLPALPSMGARAKKASGPDRYAPCPCNSGKKYKFCCAMKGR